MKSLLAFPQRPKVFDAEQYEHDVRRQVAAESEYRGDVGLEFELEGRGFVNDVAFTDGGINWVAHADGSLRGGMEYVTSAPVARDRVRIMCEGLFAELAARGVVINNSTRCSTHVHVNMTGLKINQLCVFVALYAMFEDLLTAWCGETRVGNLFALRLCDSSAAVDRWVRAFRTGDFDFNGEQRYLALNPAALRKFGSLEARALRGLETADPAVSWCEILLRLRDVATGATYANPTELAIQLSMLGGRGMFDSIFDGLIVKESLLVLAEQNAVNVEQSVRDGFRRIQPAIYSLPWEEVLNEISKPWIPNPFAKPRAPRMNPARGLHRMIDETEAEMYDD